jgi:signal transduction histidine kinase
VRSGLQGMRERVERLGGTLAITSAPESGTLVRARVLIRDYDTDFDDESLAEDAARHDDAGRPDTG